MAKPRNFFVPPQSDFSHKHTEFGEDLSFRSRAIAICVNVATPTSDVFAYRSYLESEVRTFFDNY